MLSSKNIQSLLFICLSNVAFAGSMGPVCTPSQVTVPCAQGRWAVGAEALGLSSAYSSPLSYLGNASRIPTDGNLVTNRPDWTWGFKLDGAYYFDAGQDISLDWSHLTNHQTEKQAINIVNLTQRGGIFLDHVAISPNWDMVNLEMGQRVHFSETINMRFHGGLQYSRIETERAEYTVPVNLNYAFKHASSQFNGVGARGGIQGQYDINKQLSVYADSSLALLTGQSTFHQLLEGIEGQGASGLVGLTTLYIDTKQRLVVPELELKAGVNYTVALPQGNLTFNAGYMAINYLSVLPFVNHSNSTATDGNISNANFSLHGPYFGAHWMS